MEFAWGFQSRIAGLSKTSPSFFYPPPTTFLGALGESIARKLGVGEYAGRDIISSLSRNLLAFGVRPLNCIPQKYEDLNRIIAVKITGGIHYPTPKNIFASYDSPARGKTILVSLDDNSPAMRFFLVFNEAHIKFEEKTLEVDESAFWRIHRLGSKESVVSVVDVRRKDDVKAESGRIISNYSFPVVDGIKPRECLQGRWFYEVYTSPKDVHYFEKVNPILSYLKKETVVPFVIPILVTRDSEPKYIVEVSNPAAFYRVDGETVVGWRE